MIRSGALAVGMVALAIGILAPAVGAQERSTLRIDQAVPRDCAAEPLPEGTPGTARPSWTAPASGLLTSRLDGDLGSDWDLALFRDGDAIGASTNFGSVERATAWVSPGDRIEVQACRRDGGRESVPLALDLHAMTLPAPTPERFSMESVPITSPQDLVRLEALGLDVTEDVSATDVSVALYSDAERALLAAAGYDSTTLIPDLAAEDAADRRVERRAAAAAPRSALPSGRDSYRVYEDYTSEMKTLAEENPALVRELNLGPSFEGRPIQGIEVSDQVLREDDGKPVYLQMGLHHAREWPSGEWPMEFAHTLVQGYKANDARIEALLETVRVVIVPVVNPDGFIASRSWGTSPLDDDPNATLPLAVANQAAYIRKNCRPTGAGDAAIPCAQRTGSGVDLNRNYGYYWGGPGSSTNTTTQSYRGTGPFSEPESQAVRAYTSTVHPTVFITNHTFTDDGKWLRQPGFDDPAIFPQDAIGSVVPDEVAMKSLGDAMEGATGFSSERAYETLGSITGATEDWNYYAQGTYGYTPEARGLNFHPNYADAVVKEYEGDDAHPGQGVREAYLIAGERAANAADHGVIQGSGPPGATMRLRKEFDSPTHPSSGTPPLHDVLDTTLKVGASGSYEWHVNPSSRPDLDSGPGQNPPAETWTMTCERPGQGSFGPVQVSVDRGEVETEDWGATCGVDPPVNTPPTADFVFGPTAPLVGQRVVFLSASTDSDGAIAATEWDLDGDDEFDDGTDLAVSRTFDTAGTHQVSIRVTDDDGDSDTRTREVVVSVPPPPAAPPAAASLPTPVVQQSIPVVSGVDRCTKLRQRFKKAKSKQRKRKLRGKLRKRGCLKAKKRGKGRARKRR
jgi:hypothetical protein